MAEDSGAALEAALRPLHLRDAPVSVIWAAGVGHTGASVDAMHAETAAVQSMCAAIAQLPTASRARVSVLFASSAGALYGGHGNSEISESDLPCPVTAYGREKLAQEEIPSHVRRGDGMSGRDLPLQQPVRAGWWSADGARARFDGGTGDSAAPADGGVRQSRHET